MRFARLLLFFNIKKSKKSIKFWHIWKIQKHIRIFLTSWSIMKTRLQSVDYQINGSLFLKYILEGGDYYKNGKEWVYLLIFVISYIRCIYWILLFPKWLGYDYFYRILEKLTCPNYLIQDLKDRPRFMVFYGFGIFHKNKYEVKP